MRRAFVIIVLFALLGSGCGIHDPYNDPEAKRERAEAAKQSGEAFDDGIDPAVQEAAAERQEAEEAPATEAAATPEATLRRAALLAGSWESFEIAGNFRRLALMSVGIARGEFELAARQADENPDQQGAGLRSSATVEALSVTGTGDRRRGLVVTRERLTGAAELDGEAPDYKVTLADLERRDDRWVILTWSPQP